MRLIVHLGLHKTGSTYLQHVMNLNHGELLMAGVYYEKQPGYPAHHDTAWDLLRGDNARLLTMLACASEAGCHTTILSSEDLEGAIFDPAAIELIEQTARACDVAEIEWHLCVRDPGEYFSSLYAQLQHHVFADTSAMLFEVLRDGMIMMLDPLRGQGGTPFWCYCFDHGRYISAFADRTCHPVFVHDYRDAQPFPGWRILERAGGLDVIQRHPGAEARNARLSSAAVREGHWQQISRLLTSDEQRRLIMPLVRDSIRRSGASVSRYAKVVSETFSEGTAALLETYALPEQETSATSEATAARVGTEAAVIRRAA